MHSALMMKSVDEGHVVDFRWMIILQQFGWDRFLKDRIFRICECLMIRAPRFGECKAVERIFVSCVRKRVDCGCCSVGEGKVKLLSTI